MRLLKGRTMKTHFAMLCMMLVAFACSGCASVLTARGPLKSELVDGEASAGDFSHYEYSYHILRDTIYLEEVPMCMEEREKIRVMQKKPRGFYLMILEMPLFGLGLVDMIYTNTIVEKSRREIPLTTYETGNAIECGEIGPAENITLVVLNYREGIEKSAKTDKNGKVELQAVLPDDLSGYIFLRIHLDKKPALSFYHTYYAE